MTDCELIVSILSDKKPHHVLEIMQRGKPGSINWAVRSRVSDLQKKGYKIMHEIAHDGMAIYTLLEYPDNEKPKYRYDETGQGELFL